MGRTLDDLIKSVKDKNDDLFFLFGNKNLMVLDDGKNLNIVVLYNIITSKWIKNNIDSRIEKEDHSFAVGLNGRIYDLDVETKKFHNQKFNVYSFEGHELDTLYSHSNKSKKLFWTTEKYSVLDHYTADDKLSYKILQDIIEPAINMEHDRKQEKEMSM